MKIQDVMSAPAQTCRPSSELGVAATTMLETDCGCLPVVDGHGRVVGILTDRDVCLAVAARHKSPWQIPVRDAMTKRVVTCQQTDDVSVALAAMTEHRVRRLPVVDAEGLLKGVLSIDDLIRHAGTGRARVAPEALLDTLRAVATPKVFRSEIISA